MSKYPWPVSMLEGHNIEEVTLAFFQRYVEDYDKKNDEAKALYEEHQLLKDTSAKQERYIAELEKQIGLLQKTLDLVDKNKPRFIVRPGKVSQDDLGAVQNGPVILHKETDSIIPIYPNQWIPVAERLPEKEVEVLCRKKNGGCWVAEWNYCDDQMWTDHEAWASETEVTHWMPLPEPPKDVDHGSV